MNNTAKMLVVAAIMACPLVMASAAPVESSVTMQSQQNQVSYKGVVKDAATGEPLAGASVILKGSTQYGTSTDLDGNFVLSIPSGTKPELEVSFISYQTQVVVVSKTSGIVILLAEDSNFLEEVQVVAYGKQKKTSITGAITSIGSEDLLKSPSGSAANSLAGALTGVSTIQVSGQPGAEDPDIYVRGSGSLTNEASSPLLLLR